MVDVKSGRLSAKIITNGQFGYIKDPQTLSTRRRRLKAQGTVKCRVLPLTARVLGVWRDAVTGEARRCPE